MFKGPQPVLPRFALRGSAHSEHMSITLSSADLEQLRRSIQLLVSPMEFECVADWRSAVNHSLKDLLNADSAGFLLPVPNGLFMYSEEHDPAELAKFPDYAAPNLADGRPVFSGMVEAGTSRLADVYGSDYHRYLESPYYN